MDAVNPPLRKIIHVDMDAFYASVEQRDRPELRGKPVVVGGPPQSRGVVCTASYEARKFGVHSAMPCAQAYRLCPEAVFVMPDFSKYSEVSERIHEIFREYTERVEPLSLDEAFLDVTENRIGEVSATRVAERIRADIRAATGLTASAGVAPNKFLAKVASDLKKPDGLAVIRPERVEEFLRDLPVRKVPGIGKVTEEACHRHGIRTCSDFLRHTEEQLVAWFGSSGPWFLQLARGIDPRPVVTDWVRKSCGIEDTFARDLTTTGAALAELERLAKGLEARLGSEPARGRTITLKVKYADFRQITRSRSLDHRTRDAGLILEVARELLAGTEVGRRPVRLLGLSVSNLDTEILAEQLFFPFYEAMPEPDRSTHRDAERVRDDETERQRRIDRDRLHVEAEPGERRDRGDRERVVGRAVGRGRDGPER